jgi:DNA-binding MarR family transcriptional regulator
MYNIIEPLEKVIESASNLLTEMEENAFRDERFSELSMRQMLYLNTIIRLGHPTFSDLARELSVSKPSVTANVSLLIRKGYVLKVQDPEDLRSFHIILTPKAKEYDELHQNIHRNIALILASRLDAEEVEQLSRILSKALMSGKP